MSLASICFPLGTDAASHGEMGQDGLQPRRIATYEEQCLAPRGPYARTVRRDRRVRTDYQIRFIQSPGARSATSGRGRAMLSTWSRRGSSPKVLSAHVCVLGRVEASARLTHDGVESGTGLSLVAGLGENPVLASCPAAGTTADRGSASLHIASGPRERIPPDFATAPSIARMPSRACLRDHALVLLEAMAPIHAVPLPIESRG